MHGVAAAHATTTNCAPQCWKPRVRTVPTVVDNAWLVPQNPMRASKLCSLSLLMLSQACRRQPFSAKDMDGISVTRDPAPVSVSDS